MESQRKSSRLWLPVWIALGIGVGIIIGNRFSIFSRATGVQGSSKINAVLDYINKSYVDTVNANELIESALINVVQELDPHSAYIPAAEMKRVNEEMEGHFSGIGVSFYILNDTITVTSIIPGGPSEAAGIISGDRIVSVNDTVVAGKKMTNDRVFSLLRGEKGSQVKLGIMRTSIKNKKVITVTRDDIPMNSVQASYMLSSNIGYIKVGTFGYNTFSEFITAISGLKSQGSTSFVIDLRGNVGGSLETVVAMVNEFLQKGQLIVYAEGRDFPRSDNVANGSGTCKDDQVIVLIDELSASASEIFSGAIQDHDRGLVLGRRSFGKGLVQSERKFADGSAIRLTVARYYTPSGRSIQRKYQKGRYDEYEMEAINRYMAGDYLNADTLKNAPTFKTEGGRTVFGGDGIMPDIFVARDTTGINSYYNALINKNVILDYAMTYSDANRNKLKAFKSWKALYSYLKEQPLLENIIRYANEKGVQPRPYYIRESAGLIESQLMSFVVRNFFGEEAFFSVLQENDILIRKAVSLINSGKASPKAIVTKSYLSALHDISYPYNNMVYQRLMITKNIA